MRKIIYICVLALTALSCAKTPDFPLDEVALVSFQSWMSRNAPNAHVLEGNSQGDIYIEYFERGPVLADSLKIKDEMWVHLHYTGYMLSGKTFVTRDSTLSRVSNKWVKTTHWVDEFLQYRNINGNGVICQGMTDVLPMLNTGDSVRVYFAMSKSFTGAGYSINDGYLGETTEYTEYPVYFDIRVGKTLSNPYWSQLQAVNSYAKQQWGKELTDTVFKDTYMRKLHANPTGDSIGADTIVNVFYKQTFLDGFMITTNSDSIAKVYDRYVSTDNYGLDRFKPNSETESVPKFFMEAVKKMRRGETAEFLINSSSSKQGNIGDFTGKPQIQHYTPTIYTVIVLTKAQETHEDLK